MVVGGMGGGVRNEITHLSTRIQRAIRRKELIKVDTSITIGVGETEEGIRTLACFMIDMGIDLLDLTSTSLHDII